jgi:hypothetical protein
MGLGPDLEIYLEFNYVHVEYESTFVRKKMWVYWCLDPTPYPISERPIHKTHKSVEVTRHIINKMD